MLWSFHCLKKLAQEIINCQRLKRHDDRATQILIGQLDELFVLEDEFHRHAVPVASVVDLAVRVDEAAEARHTLLRG